MSNENLMSLTCKKCGKNLEIPSDLAEFACMYCGEKMSIADFASTDSIDSLTEDLSVCITENRTLLKDFAREKYASAFNSYLIKYRPAIERINAGIMANPVRKQEILEHTARLFISNLKAAWEADSRWKSRSKRALLQEDDKLVMAIFMIPMIIEQGFAASYDIAEAIHAEWMKTYPKSPFMIGTYSEINNGFRKKIFGLCFITTAVCEFDNKPDDCRELTTLRAFRDSYLASQPDGPALIDEYYENAPVIVTLMDLTADREKCYTSLRDKYILPCVEDAEAGRMEACKSRYVRMMRELEKKYLLRS